MPDLLYLVVGLLLVGLGWWPRRLLRSAVGRSRLVVGSPLVSFFFSARTVSRLWVAFSWVFVVSGAGLMFGGLANILEAEGVLSHTAWRVASAIAFVLVFAWPPLPILAWALARPRSWMLVWPDPTSFDDLTRRLRGSEGRRHDADR